MLKHFAHQTRCSGEIECTEINHLRRERREARRRVLELRQAGKDLVAAGVNLWSRRANLVRDQLLEAMRQYRLLSREIRIWQCYLW